MKRSKSEYVIQTVANALRLLEAFREEEELGVTELSRRLVLHKNNVFRLLATLEEKGYVEQSPGSERYRLGIRCLEAGQAYVRSRSLIPLARPVLAAMARETGETVHLGVLVDFEVVHLDGEQPERLVLTSTRVGQRLPAHCTALGKALLASGEPLLWERFEAARIRGGVLPRRTAATITDRDKFFDHLRGVAGQGYALDLEECEEGLCCAAAPVVDARGHAVAALSVSAPIFRLGPEELVAHCAPRVAAAAAQLSRRLGRLA